MYKSAAILAALCFTMGQAIYGSVVSGVSINGFHILSDLEAGAANVSPGLLIGSTTGSFLFNFQLQSQLSANVGVQAQSEFLTVDFSPNAGGDLAAPENYTSPAPQAQLNLPGSVSFTQTYTTAGTFNGSLSFNLGNTSNVYSGDAGPESNPVFSFSLNSGGSASGGSTSGGSTTTGSSTPASDPATTVTNALGGGPIASIDSNLGKAAVPEPNNMILMGLGLAAFGTYRCKK